MNKLRLIISTDYEADPKYYPDNATLEEMAKIDEDNWRDDNSDVIGFLCDHGYVIKVEPVCPEQEKIQKNIEKK